MKITNIAIENYRGIKERQEMPLANFSSIVGKNDSGKSIILNAIATFLDSKKYPVTEFDFNDSTKPIIIECHFCDENLEKKLKGKIKSKIKKEDGMDEFLNDLIFENSIVFQRIIKTPNKKFDSENILMKDFKETDFSFLYSKSDEDLSEIIKKYSIDIPVEGKGRNSKLEKIKYIKEFCKTEDREISNKFIPDEYKISTLLPAVELFISDYGLEADTKFKTNSVSEIQEYFIKETSDNTKKLKIIEKEIENEMETEAKAIKNYMTDYAESLKCVKIKPSIVWKDSIKSVDVSFQFDGDTKLIPMTHKGAGYRRLFMVARFRYLAEKNKGDNMIYLIEEPETFLHPSAQEDLLNAFHDLSEDNQVVITTHSPIFAGATNYNSIILCKKGTQSSYEFSEEASKKDFISKIVDELGIKPSYNLRDSHEKIVFVESSNDAKFYNIISQKIMKKELLNNKKILVLPFGGGADIESFLNIDYFDDSGRDLFLIIDSDKHINALEKQQRRAEDFSKKGKGNSYVLKKSCMENYYHPRAFERVYGIEGEVFSFFSDEESAVKSIKKIVQDNELKNIREKNNIKVFEEMTEDECNEVVEIELKNFLESILN